MRWLDGLIDSRDMNLNKLQEIVEARGAWHVLQSMVSPRVGHDSVTEQQQKGGNHISMTSWFSLKTLHVEQLDMSLMFRKFRYLECCILSNYDSRAKQWCFSYLQAPKKFLFSWYFTNSLSPLALVIWFTNRFQFHELSIFIYTNSDECVQRSAISLPLCPSLALHFHSYFSDYIDI